MKINRHVLNFGPRVKKSSIKNFQIAESVLTGAPVEYGSVNLEMGRINKNEFCLNVKYPFSIMTAFAIALSSFDQ